jgi:mannose/fructose/N-acetylgalactosamine-specific phosphotransferase system component IID
MLIPLVVIAWGYVVLMMAVAEATSTTGTVLGAIFTLLLYGLLPIALVIYLMRAPARSRANKAREMTAQEQARREAACASGLPDQGGEAAGDSVTPVREKL